MNDDYLDVEPGEYLPTPVTVALVDQQRAHALDVLRTAPAVMLTMMSVEGQSTHWAFYGRESPEDMVPFLVYAAMRAMRDVMAATHLDSTTAAALVAAAVERHEAAREEGR